MDRQTLKRYKKDERELMLIDRALVGLYDRLEGVPVVSGKVTKSGDDFPYIEEHITVQIPEPVEATDIKDRIREKETRRTVLQAEMDAVEEFIRGLPEGIDKRIFELTYLEGMKQWQIADEVGYTQGRISQLIGEYLKD